MDIHNSDSYMTRDQLETSTKVCDQDKLPVIQMAIIIAVMIQLTLLASCFCWFLVCVFDSGQLTIIYPQHWRLMWACGPVCCW